MKLSAISHQLSAKSRISQFFTENCLLPTVYSSKGASSMVVLVLVVLLLIVGWEVMTFSKQFIDAGGGRAAPGLTPLSGVGCTGSNNKFDCYDQDEGAGLLEN